MRLSTEALLNELQRFQVLREDIVAWENALGMTIPTDANNQPMYSENHLNLFKNIKKHLALGKSFVDIQQLVQIPANLSVTAVQEAVQNNGHEVKQTPVVLPVAEPKTESKSAITPQSLRPPVVSNNPMIPRMTSQPSPTQSALMAPPSFPSSGTLSSNPLITTGATTRPMAAPMPTALQAHQNDVMDLLRQTMAEKDQLQQQLVEAEKLNSHLNNANGMFHRKVKQLGDELKAAQAAGDQNRLFQLMEDKARLHHQVLDSEKTIGQLKKQLVVSDELMQQARQESMAIEQQRLKQIQFLQSELSSGDGSLFNPAVFCGHWQEEAHWLETRFDTYGVEIPADRQRLLSIVEPPTQLMGSMAVLSQTYRLEQQPQWQRTETLLLMAPTSTRLQGIMDVTYRLNDTPVAQAWYRISATKQP